MSKTEYLNLNLTPDVTDESFVQWRNSIDGEENSNMDIIDDKFGEVDSSIQDRYNGNESDELCLPKDKVDGVSVQTKFAVNNEAINYQIWGNSYQDTRSGKNLFEFSNNTDDYIKYTTTTLNIDNNSISANITENNMSSWILNRKIYVKPNTYYTFSMKCSHLDSYGRMRYLVRCYNSNDEIIKTSCTKGTYNSSYKSFYIDLDTAHTFNVTEDVAYIMIGSVATISQGTMGEFVTFSDIQLEIGSTATDYEPYGVMPSPEFPSEIQSVGDKTKNLFDKSTVIGNAYINDQTGDIKSDSKYANTNASDWIDISGMSNLYFVQNTVRNWHAFYDENKVYISGINGYGSRVVPTGAKYLRCTVVNECLDTFMVFEGKSEQPYEPFGYKIPILTRGKNLLNFDSLPIFDRQEDGSYKSNRTITNINSVIPLNLPIENYILSLDIKCETNKNYRPIIHYKDGTYTDMYVISTGDYIHMEKVLKNKEIDYFNFSYNGVSSNVYIKNIQLEKGPTSTDYEPYREENINIYLNEPLRKIGDYTDYVDFASGKETYQITKIELDGTENFNVSVTDNGKLKANVLLKQKNAIPVISENIGYGISTHISNFNYTQCINTDFVNAFATASSTQRLYLALTNEVLSDLSLNGLKMWLAIQKENGTPFTVYYISQKREETVIVEPLLLKDGTNNIMADTTIQPSNISVYYYQNITDRINELINAIITQQIVNINVD